MIDAHKKGVSWFSGCVIESPNWVLFGDEDRSGLYQMSDLSLVLQFRERINSLHGVNVFGEEKLLVGFADQWTLFSVPSLQEEWTIFQKRMRGKIVLNSDWLVEIRPISPTIIGQGLSLNVSAWKWSSLSRHDRGQFPSPDVTRICELSDLSTMCTVFFPVEGSDVTIKNQDQIAVIHLATNGVDYRVDSNYTPSKFEMLFSAYSAIDWDHDTNLSRHAWFVTSDGQVVIDRDQVHSFKKPYTRISFEAADFLDDSSIGKEVTVRAGRTVLTSTVFLWYAIFSPVCFWASFVLLSANPWKRINRFKAVPSLLLGVFSVAIYLMIVVVLEPLLINVVGAAKHSGLILLLPVCLLAILFVLQRSRFRATLVCIIATSAIVSSVLTLVSMCASYFAMPALSKWGMTMLPIACSIVYYEFAAEESRKIDRSQYLAPKRWRSFADWLLNTTFALQVLHGGVLVWWATNLPLKTGNFGSGLFLLGILLTVKYLPALAIIPWLMAWLIQSCILDFRPLRTLITFLNLVPVIVSLHLF